MRAWLSRDHAEIDALLRAALDAEPFDVATFGEFRERLLRHIGIEERLLFPAVKHANEGQLPAGASVLRVDHAALTTLLVPTPDHALAHELAGLLARHNELEERPDGAYDECLALLDEQACEALLHAAEQRRPVPTTKYFDGPGTVRTADAALQKAQRA
jgi:hypothetical protein